MRNVRFQRGIVAAICLLSVACIAMQANLAQAQQFGPPMGGGGYPGQYGGNPAGPYGPMGGGPQGPMMGGPQGPMMGGMPGGQMGGPMGGPMGGQMTAQPASWSAAGVHTAPMYQEDVPSGGDQGCYGGQCGGEGGGDNDIPHLILWESGDCFWVRSEALYMKQRGIHTPPLVTTSPAGTGIAAAGVLPAATVLFGGDNINNDWTVGEKLTIGKWLSGGDACGVELNYFHINPDGEDVTFTGPILAIPVINSANGQEDSFLVNFPGFATNGSVHVDSRSEVQSASALIRKVINFNELGGCGCGCCDCCGTWRLDFVGGYRWFRLGEDLNISSAFNVVNPAVAGGTSVFTFDRFDTTNDFQGGEFGFDYQTQIGRWSAGCLTKVALGNLHQHVNLDGGQTISVPGAGSAFTPGGVFNGANNLGSYENDKFAVMPEVNLTVGYQLTCKLRATAGYNFLYIDNVARPGDQISRISSANAAAPVPANFQIHDTQYILSGGTAGLEFRY